MEDDEAARRDPKAWVQLVSGDGLWQARGSMQTELPEQKQHEETDSARGQVEGQSHQRLSRVAG